MGILNNDTQDDFLDQNLTGSNVIAMNSSKTKSGETFLAINTHQPLEGPTSWYEAHLSSNEGTNIIGTLYPGTPHILIGVNKNLGWSHTVNYPDKTDVFKLKMKLFIFLIALELQLILLLEPCKENTKHSLVLF